MLITNMNDASNLEVEALRFEDQFLRVHVFFFFFSVTLRFLEVRDDQHEGFGRNDGYMVIPCMSKRVRRRKASFNYL
jgi:hypothetical protein